LTDEARSHPILLYDGVCGLCNRIVRFVLKRDHASVFRFASLQSRIGLRILEDHGVNPTDLDTLYVVIGGDLEQRSNGRNERLLARSDAVLFVLGQLGVLWRCVGQLFRLLPSAARDWAYDTVARRRYQIFGKDDACLVPSEAVRARFLDL